jgi:hypothetical protein
MQNTLTHRGRPTLNKSIAEFTHNSIINNKIELAIIFSTGEGESPKIIN